MLNPTSASKTPLSSRIALLTGLFLAGLFGLAATILLPSDNFKKSDIQTAQRIPLAQSEPVTISESTGTSTRPALSAADLVKFCSDNVTETRSFVLFQRGTCVIIDEPCQNPLGVAREKLAKCAEGEVRFLSEPTAEGDLIVTFKEPVFQRFSRDELAKPSTWLDQAAPSLLTPAEAVTAGDGWSPSGNARYGLLARRRLLEDAAKPVPVRIIRAKSRAMASN